MYASTFSGVPSIGYMVVYYVHVCEQLSRMLTRHQTNEYESGQIINDVIRQLRVNNEGIGFSVSIDMRISGLEQNTFDGDITNSQQPASASKQTGSLFRTC